LWLFSLAVSIYFMRRMIFIAIFCFSLFDCKGNNLSQTSSAASEVFVPALAYVQLSKALTMRFEGNKIPYGWWSAGGVCIKSNEDGCFILTVDHFCHSDPEDLFGPEPEHIDYNVNFKYSFSGENLAGETGDGWVVAQNPDVDLCLIWLQGNFDHEIYAIADEENIKFFAELHNWGAPRGFFRTFPSFGLLLFEGYWGGWCDDFCQLPNNLNGNNFFMHSIPTSSGQSGSAIYLGEKLFGLQVASNSSVDSFGISARPSIINNFLRANNIVKPYL